MASPELQEELEAIWAIYDVSSDVVLGETLIEVLDGKTYTCLEIGFFYEAQPKRSFLRLKLRLPADYPTDEAAAPVFELGCIQSLISQGRLSSICRCLDSMFEEDKGPILFTWIEWLRTEVLENAQEISSHSYEPDMRAIIICEEESSGEETSDSDESTVWECGCCGSDGDAGTLTVLLSCNHRLCSMCISSVMQMEDASEMVHCCPVPHCRMALTASEVDKYRAPPDPWMSVCSHIVKTPLKDLVAFCPHCESVGKDVPVLMTAAMVTTAAEVEKDNGTCRCKCSCGLQFCGVCRSPCHPGKPCLADGKRALRMSKRRPALSKELQELAEQKAAEMPAEEPTRANGSLLEAVRRGNGDMSFEGLRETFFHLHGEDVFAGLETVFQNITMCPAPVSVAVQRRFLDALKANPQAELRPAFHGTNTRNHPSIFRDGLLIPGAGNHLKVVHGAVHGRGVYTANVDAAWLSKGFCSGPSMLVCGVLQTNCVKHVMDAMVVMDATHVVPLYYAEARGVVGHPTYTAPVVHYSGNLKKFTQSSASTGAASTAAASTKSDKSDKSNKFKEKLARRANRH